MEFTIFLLLRPLLLKTSRPPLSIPLQGIGTFTVGLPLTPASVGDTAYINFPFRIWFAHLSAALSLLHLSLTEHPASIRMKRLKWLGTSHSSQRSKFMVGATELATALPARIQWLGPYIKPTTAYLRTRMHGFVHPTRPFLHVSHLFVADAWAHLRSHPVCFWLTAPNKISRPVIFHDLGTRTCLYPYRGATFETSGYHRTSRRWMCDAALVPLFAPGPQSSFPRALPERNSLVRIRWKLPAIRLFSPW